MVFDSFIYVNLQCKFVSYLTIFRITMNRRGRVNEGERGKEVEKERESEPVRNEKEFRV